MLNKSNFKSKPFSERIKYKDNLTKRVFSAYCSEKSIGIHKLGYDGSESCKPYELETTLRYAPDHFCTLPSGKEITAELKGCKNEGVRIGCQKLQTYVEWNKLLPTFCFINNSQSGKVAFIPITQLADVAEHVGKSFDKDMGEIYLIPCNMLEWSQAPVMQKPQYADNYSE